MLMFRDWLRSNDADRELYERTKRELAKQTWKYVQNYADAKTVVVEEIVARASAAREACEMSGSAQAASHGRPSASRCSLF